MQRQKGTVCASTIGMKVQAMLLTRSGMKPWLKNSYKVLGGINGKVKGVWREKEVLSKLRRWEG